MSKRHPKQVFCIKGNPVTPLNRPISKTAWELEEDYELTYYHKGIPCHISVSKGFIWDGASIPRVAWSILGLAPGGMCLLFSLWHDLLYRTSGLSKPVGQDVTIYVDGKERFSRWDSDVMLRDLMVWQGCYKKSQVRLCYRMVHRFGKKHFGGPSPMPIPAQKPTK